MRNWQLVFAFVLVMLAVQIDVAKGLLGIIPTIAFIALVAVLIKIKKEKEMGDDYGSSYGGGGGYSSGGGGYGGGGGGYGGGGGKGKGGGSGGYGGGGGGGYYRRSIDDNTPDLPLPTNITLLQLEKALSSIYKYDQNSCVPRLICEVHANRNHGNLGNLEKGILRIFEVYHPKKPGTPGFSYRQAADFGLRSTSDSACWNMYAACDMTPPQLANIIRVME